MLITRPQRFKFEVAIQIEWGSIKIEANVIDVSATGLYISMANPLWVGATFAADLMLDPPLRTYCTVSRVDPRKGMAVRVLFPGEQDDTRFAHLMQELTETPGALLT